MPPVIPTSRAAIAETLASAFERCQQRYANGPVSVHFVTLGMFIIDKIEIPDQDVIYDNIIGGAGAFSILGARIVSEAPAASKTLGWIVDAGSDFPAEIMRELQRWETNMIIRETPERQTTRGYNVYGPGDYRAFEYLTPKKRLTPADLVEPSLVDALSFHLICSPTRCIQIVNELLSLRTDSVTEAPLLVWEPVPDLCKPSELPTCLDALKLVSIVSPNAAELGAFYGQDTTVAESRESVEANAEKWFDHGIGPQNDGPVIVRAGQNGCYIRSTSGQLWLPAYHAFPSPHVVDPTGGGNCFIGALTVQYARCGDLVYSAMCAIVAASLAIEQVGMPSLSYRTSDESHGTPPLLPLDKERVELWNGEEVVDRLRQYAFRDDVQANLEAASKSRDTI
ncbi:hypothetical protein TWF696_006830 [Orbilia brochopaga]|uniref:Carbohydrate kinase PfkB domain-containing protein n=1 Tax=Orbilia brochopaga TaxID=3140254 RepID=A0AAV9UW87_9PEZI